MVREGLAEILAEVAPAADKTPDDLPACVARVETIPYPERLQITFLHPLTKKLFVLFLLEESRKGAAT